MYQNYSRQDPLWRRIRRSLRPSVLRRQLALLVPLALLFVFLAVLGYAMFSMILSSPSAPVADSGGVQMPAKVEGDHLAAYTGDGFEPRFWNGTNLGATLPGHDPGELAPTEEDYLRWFSEMADMNVDVVRIYTILNPEFYEALSTFNAERQDAGEEPIRIIQGIWSPEEELIGEDEEGNDAFSNGIPEQFDAEIRDAVRAIHGDARLPERPGHASGAYRTDVSSYVMGWMVGTEWFPYAVQKTNDQNEGMGPFEGQYFSAGEDASPFESWLARRLETLAQEEMEYGWQRPVSFTNWLTTDPLEHPSEPLEQEDLVSVDPTHVGATNNWQAGYFASYHVYPYYPDFMRYEEEYQNYRAEDGKIDPYAGYLNELREYHEDMPLVVGEYGIPSSRGMAHRGPLGRDQGHHTEEEQGNLVAGMHQRMREEGYDGAFLFAFHDEWFKFTWNTIDFDHRRKMWLNRLTNEQNFGIISHDPGKEGEGVYLDGSTKDWDRRSGTLRKLGRWFSEGTPPVTTANYPNFDLSVTHDEAYLYLMAEKRQGEWDLSEDTLDIGFGTLENGAESSDKVPGRAFPLGGAQTLLTLGADGDQMYINSAFDYHTWYYGNQLENTPGAPEPPEEAANPDAGKFLPWRLALSRGITLPDTGKTIPFEEFDVGEMTRGVTDPGSPDYNSLADYEAEGEVLEVRVPWAMLGFTDPSQKKVWDNLYEGGEVSPTTTDGIRVYPSLNGAATEEGGSEVTPTEYDWEGWDEPTYHERRKKSFPTVKQVFSSDQLAEGGP